jgi:hypothetical protein
MSVSAAPAYAPDPASGLWNWAWLSTPVLFLAAATIMGLARSWWKPVVVVGLLLGSGVLVWSLATTWHGMWVQNPHYSEGPLQFDWLIIKGMLLSAAPATVIGWFIGRIETRPSQIWLSGLVGIWLPLVTAVSIASLAAQAGANLYWAPSLLRGFNWALLGSHGRMEPVVTTLACWTLVGPAVLCVITLKRLVSLWPERQKGWLGPAAVCLFIGGVTSGFWHYGGLYSIFATPTHELWTGSLVIAGATAGLACAVRQKAR